MTTAMPELATPAERRPSRTGPILLLVFGSLAGLVAFVLLAAGGFVTWADTSERDRDGYFTTHTHLFSTSTYALSQTKVDLEDWPSWDLATIRIHATSTDGKPVFVGVAPKDAVESYLGRVAHDDVTDVSYDPFSAEYARRAGGAPETRPAAARIWTASATGTGRQTLTWEPDAGKWAAVVMNADGSKGVHASIAVGAKVSYLGWVQAGLYGLGALLLAGAGTMIFFGGRGLRSQPREQA